MTKLEKILKKISKVERQSIKNLIIAILNKDFTGIDIAKVKSTPYS